MYGQSAEIQPQLWVSDGPRALAFYTEAFGAVTDYRLDGPDAGELIAQLSVAGARFWLTSSDRGAGRFSPESIGGSTGRLLLIVPDPDAFFAGALSGGATMLGEPSDEHGWRIGRLRDPFEHEWEIGRPLGLWPPAD